MPFKIIETLNKKENKRELCICPSAWEHHGFLLWPNKKSKKLSQIEDSVPQPNWTKIVCKVKRKNILTYELANTQLAEMLESTTTTTDQEQSVSSVSAPVSTATTIQDFNDIAAKASSSASAPTPTDAMQDVTEQEEAVYNFSISNELPTPVLAVDNNTPFVAFDIEFARITSNQMEIYKNQQEILTNQTFLKDECKKILDCQKNMMMAMAEITVKLDTVISQPEEPTVSKLSNIKHYSANSAFCLKPIQNVEDLSNLDKKLNDNNVKQEYKLKYSIVCQPGKATNCAYQLVDIFFSREFLTLCSWSGCARGEGTKVSLKQYKNVLALFFELVYECDNNYTIAENETFFKSVLKNATKRKNSKLQRSSTSRNSHKKQKLSETQNSVQNEENVSQENQDNNIEPHLWVQITDNLEIEVNNQNKDEAQNTDNSQNKDMVENQNIFSEKNETIEDNNITREDNASVDISEENGGCV